MKILIIEDDQNKLKQLSEFINNQNKKYLIVEKHSYQSGLKEIISNTYDLIILDMSMPTFYISPNENGGKPRIFAGKEILHQMMRRNINIPVVVVTQFESFGEPRNSTSLTELNKELKDQYVNYLGAIYYNASLNNWKTELENVLNNKRETE